ncbi:MAG: hypothetical protein KGD63_05755 [Candidatus Lokiarchaeota archaeon]|nr:hypothetical protein [Candidatus Lokiarchaeota archaeon]
MIICTNCGSVNADNEGRICRKCGALLPISSKTPRLKITTNKKKSKKKEIEKPDELIKKKINIENQLIGERAIFKNLAKKKKKKDKLELQEIPKADPFEIKIENPNKEIISNKQNEKDILKEIDPTPFNGAIFSDNVVDNSIIKPQKKKTKLEPKININIKSKKKQEQPISSNIVQKQQQLEIDMREVLGFLSEKLDTYEEIPIKKFKKKVPNKKEEIQPDSMNEILKNLLKIDMYIEASAIIKNEGTILASAISDRISDSLFATIGQNLSMIGMDIIKGLSAGQLSSIVIRGTEGVLHLAPLEQNNPNLNNMILIMFSNPKVKSGIVNIAKNMVRKQVKKYLGIN